MRVSVISLDFAGVIAPKDFIDFFWFFVIPKRVARLERIPLYEAIKYVDREYWSVPTDSLDWYLPRFWLERFGIDADESDLIEEALEFAEPFGDALEAIPALGLRYRIIISTNTPSSFVEGFLKRYPQIGAWIEGIYSCIDMLNKPRKDREFFMEVARAVGANVSEVLHVGDNPQSDYVEAKAAGMRAILIDRSSRCSSAVSNLYQLLEVLL
ncbi:MAG: HAD family hydrolase [Crenarchaeota archaeon]|nr:HAD family hydrolase [Thermoproteota archaeon]